MKTIKKCTYPPLAPGDLLTEAEAADLLRLKPGTLRAMRTQKVYRGFGPAYIQRPPNPNRASRSGRGSGPTLYHRADLAAWAFGHRHDPATE